MAQFVFSNKLIPQHGRSGSYWSVCSHACVCVCVSERAHVCANFNVGHSILITKR